MIKISGLDHLIGTIDKMTNTLTEKVKEIVNKLADIGVSVARVQFAQSIYDGTNDVIVESPVWVSENVLQINAVGKAVAFIEFGTGLHYREERHPKEADFLFYRGSYGKHQGLNDFWYYHGEPGTNGIVTGNMVKTHGNPANRCLYDSAKEMRQRIYEIAKGVMSS